MSRHVKIGPLIVGQEGPAGVITIKINEAERGEPGTSTSVSTGEAREIVTTLVEMLSSERRMADERSATVRWIRSQRSKLGSWSEIAKAIERGDHRR